MTDKRTPGSSNPSTPDVEQLRQQATEARNAGDHARADQLDQQIRQAEGK